MADRIVKSVVLHAPPHRVWPAITDAKAFGTWFGAEFDFEEAGDGTKLTVTESGFDELPADRRAEAFKSNEGGWEKQMGLVRNFVERH